MMRITASVELQMKESSKSHRVTHSLRPPVSLGWAAEEVCCVTVLHGQSVSC